jgi:hypothetical protein
MTQMDADEKSEHDLFRKMSTLFLSAFIRVPPFTTTEGPPT